MKTSLYTIAHNIRNAAQITIEAYLRRAVLHRQPNVPAPYHRPIYSRYFRSGWGYLKLRR